MPQFLSPEQRLFDQAQAEPPGGPAQEELFALLRRRGQHELVLELQGADDGLAPATATLDGEELTGAPAEIPTLVLNWRRALIKSGLLLAGLAGLLAALVMGIQVWPEVKVAWLAKQAQTDLQSGTPQARVAAAAVILRAGVSDEEVPAFLAALKPDLLNTEQQLAVLELLGKSKLEAQAQLDYYLRLLEQVEAPAVRKRTFELLRWRWGLVYNLNGQRRSDSKLPPQAYAALLAFCERHPELRGELLRLACNRPPDTDPRPSADWVLACCQDAAPNLRLFGQQLLPELLLLRGREALAADTVMQEAIPLALRRGDELEFYAALEAGLRLGLPEALAHYLEAIRPSLLWPRRGTPARANKPFAEHVQRLDAFDRHVLSDALEYELNADVALVLEEALRRYDTRQGAPR